MGDTYLEILADLNDKMGLVSPKGYRPGLATNKLIHARMQEGFTVDDFKHVHTVMCAKWGDDDNMYQYLRPATLYQASKFEGYLNTRAPKAKVVPEEWR